MSTTSVPKFPPLDCSLFFPDLINFHMQLNPTLPMWIYADEQGITEITFLEFGRAAHRIAHALRPERTGDDGQVVMLIANTDTILHQAVVAGMSIAGLVPFPVSPRNSPAAVIDMMGKINCSRIVTLNYAHQSLIEGVRKQGSSLSFTVEDMPTMSYAFPKLGREMEADLFVPYPQPASRLAPDVPSIYIHSSGSTGFPKPIPQSYKVQIHWMYHMITAYFGNLSLCERIGAMAFPPFHALGISMQLYLPLAHLATVAVYPPQMVVDQQAMPIVPTSDNILDNVRRTHCKIVFVVPTFLEQWAASTEDVKALTKLDKIIYGGGPLAEKIGNALWAAGVNISIAYGGTEFGSPLSSRGRAEIEDGGWMWARFSGDMQVRWAHQGDDTYECQILTTESNQLAIENLPDVKGYATGDLFIKHPTENLWKIIGRVDDVITLASGEKTVPMPMESTIFGSPFLQGVIMFGRGRNQVGILVEPRPEYAVDILDDNAVATFRDQIWPVVEEANIIAPAFARIFKEMILIVDSEHPMIRTPKGTIQRKATISAYEHKIDSLYNNMQAGHRSMNGLIGPSSWTTEDVLIWLAAHASTVSNGRTVDVNVDLFAQGFDSLSATNLRNQIMNGFLKASHDHIRDLVSVISPNIVFENPTIQLLASRIVNLVAEQSVSQTLDMKLQHVAAMNEMIEKYSIGLSRTTPPMANGIMNDTDSYLNGDSAVVLLTGSTGGLGSFLLSQLLQNPKVEKVYAVNRSSSSASIEERQKSAFVDKGLSVDLLNSRKLVYVETDASLDDCGMPRELYEEIRDSVTMIIHNAWRLDFNLSLVSFEPNIKATRNLIDIALSRRNRRLVRFVFTSTIGTAQSWDRTKGAFPEELQLDPSTAVGPGYGESKYVCERIIAKSGLCATSLRIGQIAGGRNGSWTTNDWVPIIVKSSIALGSLPNSLGVVSWMRAEDVAMAIIDIGLSSSASQSLNIMNPQRVLWSDITSLLRDAILAEKSWDGDRLTIVPFAEWVVRLEKKAASASAQDYTNFPALKLLEMFRAMARNDEELSRTQGTRVVFEAGSVADFSTTEAQRVSNAVLRMKAVGETEVRAWIQYWILKGLF